MGNSYDLGRCCLVCGISVSASDFPGCQTADDDEVGGYATQILYTLPVTYMEVCMFLIRMIVLLLQRLTLIQIHLGFGFVQNLCEIW